MKQRIILITLFFFTGMLSLSAQTGTIKGKIVNQINNEPIPFANVTIDSTSIGVTSDFDGNYRIDNLKPGLYNVTVSFVGFKSESVLELQVSSVRPTTYDFYLTEETALDEVVISGSQFRKTAESPLSKQTIGVSEIYRSPGGNQRYFQSIANFTRCCIFSLLSK